MIGTDIAIDLGTSRFKVYLDGKGIVLSEPSILAVDNVTDEVIAMGTEAYDMLGRTSERITVSRPLNNGVISDFSMAELLISHYLKQVSGSRMFMPRVVVSVPCGITEVEKRAVVDAITAAGVRKVCLIEEPVAAAIGAGVDIAEPHGTMIVDIGEGATDMAVISLNGIAIANSTHIAGANFNDAIIKYVRKKFNLVIGDRMAEEAKIAIGCAYPRKKLATFTLKGRHAMSGLPETTVMNSDEMIEASSSRPSPLCARCRPPWRRPRRSCWRTSSPTAFTSPAARPTCMGSPPCSRKRPRSRWSPSTTRRTAWCWGPGRPSSTSTRSTAAPTGN